MLFRRDKSVYINSDLTIDLLIIIIIAIQSAPKVPTPCPSQKRRRILENDEECFQLIPGVSLSVEKILNRRAGEATKGGNFKIGTSCSISVKKSLQDKNFFFEPAMIFKENTGYDRRKIYIIECIFFSKTLWKIQNYKTCAQLQRLVCILVMKI